MEDRRPLPELPDRRVPAAGHIPFVGAFESTYMPAHDVDVAELTGHVDRWRDDCDALIESGVTYVRYPVRWHRVERAPGCFDWAETARTLGYLEARGLTPIVDLLHHTSYPRWLAGGFADRRFRPAFLRYCGRFAARFPGTRAYTAFNEPFATLFLAGHEGVWPPHGTGVGSLVELLRTVLPTIGQAIRGLRERLPQAVHVYVDTCEGHVGLDRAGHAYAAMANDRRFFVLDALLGRANPSGPFARLVRAAGGDDLFRLEPMPVDALGLDYYAHSEWSYTAGRAVAPSERPVGLAALMERYAARYALPLMLTETNIRGATSDRATWLRYTLEQCERARDGGVPVAGYCWFPFVDSVDWNSLLRRADGYIDPVGVLELDETLRRRPSSMSEAYARAARGAPSHELPAFRFTPPVERWLAPLLPQMAHFEWQDAPPQEVVRFDGGRLRRISTEEAA